MRLEPWKNIPLPVVIATNPGEQAPHTHHHPFHPGTGLVGKALSFTPFSGVETDALRNKMTCPESGR